MAEAAKRKMHLQFLLECITGSPRIDARYQLDKTSSQLLGGRTTELSKHFDQHLRCRRIWTPYQGLCQTDASKIVYFRDFLASAWATEVRNYETIILTTFRNNLLDAASKLTSMYVLNPAMRGTSKVEVCRSDKNTFTIVLPTEETVGIGNLTECQAAADALNRALQVWQTKAIAAHQGAWVSKRIPDATVWQQVPDPEAVPWGPLQRRMAVNPRLRQEVPR